MRNVVFAVFVFLMVTVLSCGKKDSPSPCEASFDPCARTAPASETQQIETYLSANSLTATKHCSGVYYKIETQGTGVTPNNCSRVTVSYIGTLTNGTEFDRSQQDVTFILYELIDAWKIILPQVKEGGSLKLYVPPSFGYGPNPYGPIPGNSILVFEIQLKDVS